MGKLLAQSFGQEWRCEVLVVDMGGIMGWLVHSSGHGGWYEVVVGVVETVGLLA